MRKKKYPLEPLARMKKDRAETRTRELGGAVAAREAIQNEREGKVRSREAARASANVVRALERTALEKGELTALDLARAGTWEVRVRAEDASRSREVDEAVAAGARARAAEATAKAKVAEARAESESVHRHEERWEAAGKKADEAQEEEALAEAVHAGGIPPGPTGRPKRAP